MTALVVVPVEPVVLVVVVVAAVQLPLRVDRQRSDPSPHSWTVVPGDFESRRVMVAAVVLWH